MRHHLLTALVIVFSLSVKAQEPDSVKKAYVVPPGVIEAQPEFPGGIDKLYDFIRQNLRATGDHGKLILSFTIDIDGSLNDIKIIKSLSEKADAEAIRVFKRSPKWIPGIQNGRALRVRYALPLSFD